MMRTTASILLIALFASLHSFGQEIEVSATLTGPKQIQLGQQTEILLEARFPAQMLFGWPRLEQQLTDKVEIVSAGKIDTTHDSNNITTRILRQKLMVTSFDTGWHVIEPFTFSTESKTLESNPLIIGVQGVVLSEKDEIKDIKGPVFVRITLLEWLLENWMWFAGAYGILALLAFLAYLIGHDKKVTQVVIEKIPSRPAHEVAMEKLTALKAQKLWQQERVKEYYIQLSDITREYIELRFIVPALEQTTDEIMQGMSRSELSHQQLGELRQLLTLSDLVKFAKEKPLPSENERCIEMAQSLITQTRITPKAVEE